MRVTETSSDFVREPFLAPFGFKGSYVNAAWQAEATMTGSEGCRGVGFGTQGVLWSDAAVFTANSESAGNSMMFLVTSYALKQAEGKEWTDPLDLLDQLLPDVYEYAKSVTCNPNLRLTFALNALVAVDNAAWQLFANANDVTSFDDMIPAAFRPALSGKHDRLACIPLMSYGVSREQIKAEADAGHFFQKIKVGSDPDKDGDLDKMLEWDKQRLSEIHDLLKDIETPYTDNGHCAYYLDANGRYDSKDRLMRLVDHADKIGALERIVLFEEPFPEEHKEDVSDIPLRLAADESAHSDKDALERIDLGYTAIALKPIAKTMSMSLRIAQIAHDKNVPCFCADLTVTPILVDWNKNVAARLASLPGLKIGVLESNGHQNYKNWQRMVSEHPCAGASWITPVDGIFNLDETFYRESGGILKNIGGANGE